MQAICQVSLDALNKNFKYFQNRIHPAQIIPVVKANAYGHGMVRISQYLSQELGVNTVAVATLEEAQELAAVLPEILILIFSRVFPSELSRVPGNAILSVGSLDDAMALIASEMPDIKVHLNVNTGMNRLGLSPDEAFQLVSKKSSNLRIEGVYSHYSSSDTASEIAYLKQNAAFRELLEKLRTQGFEGIIHMANSAASLHEDQTPFDAVRLGIGLYGYDTSPGGKHQAFLEPAMTIKAPIIRVSRIAAGTSVSYGEKWQATTDTNIGTLRIGYADGYSRSLTNRGMVSFRGKSYPVIGTVTMDHIMIDLGQDEPKTGEMFDVMGGEMPLVHIQRISKLLDTIPYEICCAISPRIERKY